MNYRTDFSDQIRLFYNETSQSSLYSYDHCSRKYKWRRNVHFQKGNLHRNLYEVYTIETAEKVISAAVFISTLLTFEMLQCMPLKRDVYHRVLRITTTKFLKCPVFLRKLLPNHVNLVASSLVMFTVLRKENILYH